MDFINAHIKKMVRRNKWKSSDLKRIGNMYERVYDKMVEASEKCSCDADNGRRCDNITHALMTRWERLLYRLDVACRDNLKQA